MSVVYTNSDYGLAGFRELNQRAGSYNICFPNPLEIKTQLIGDEQYKLVAKELSQRKRAKGKTLYIFWKPIAHSTFKVRIQTLASNS